MSERYKSNRSNWSDGAGRAHLARYYLGRGFIEISDSVLDIGCGNGVGTEIYSDVALSVTGIDYSKETIDGAKRDWQEPIKQGFVNFDVVNLDDIDGGLNDWLNGNDDRGVERTYDVGIAFEVLEHLEDPKKTVERLLKNIKKIFIFSVPIGEEKGENPYHKQTFPSYDNPKLLMKDTGWKEFHSYRQGRHGIYVYYR